MPIYTECDGAMLSRNVRSAMRIANQLALRPGSYWFQTREGVRVIRAKLVLNVVLLALITVCVSLPVADASHSIVVIIGATAGALALVNAPTFLLRAESLVETLVSGVFGLSVDHKRDISLAVRRNIISESYSHLW